MSNLLQPIRDRIDRVQQAALGLLASCHDDVDGMVLHDRAIEAVRTLEVDGQLVADLRAEAIRAEMRRDGWDTWHHQSRKKAVRDFEAIADILDQLLTDLRLLRRREAAEIAQLRRTA